jgi:hypothetical protein
MLLVISKVAKVPLFIWPAIRELQKQRLVGSFNVLWAVAGGYVRYAACATFLHKASSRAGLDWGYHIPRLCGPCFKDGSGVFR